MGPLLDAGRLGCVLWQLPPNFARDDERLVAWLGTLPDGRHALEVRHASWFTLDVYARLHERDVALVEAHRKGLDLPRAPRTASFRFLRFHHGERGRRGSYSDTELDAIAADLGDRPGYAYFNNDWEAFAPRNAAGVIRRSARAAAG